MFTQGIIEIFKFLLSEKGKVRRYTIVISIMVVLLTPLLIYAQDIHDAISNYTTWASLFLYFVLAPILYGAISWAEGSENKEVI